MVGWLRRKQDAATHQPGVPLWPAELSRAAGVDASSAEYAELCLTPAFPEKPESRDIQDGYAFPRIIEAQSSYGLRSTQLGQVVSELLADPRYADHDSLYGWLAIANQDTRHEFEVLAEGLRVCPRKFLLLDRTGSAMLKRGRGADALYYWAHAVRNAEALGNYSYAYNALVVVARTFGQRKAANHFASRENPSMPPTEVDSQTANLITEVFRSRTKSMARVVEALANPA